MKRVGVIGGGQLAWMMGKAAKKLGVDLIVQTPNPADPAVKTASSTIFATIDDINATKRLAKECDIITFENEFVDLEQLFLLEQQGVCFHPNLIILKRLLDKYHQLSYFQSQSLPTPQFFLLDAEINSSQIKYIEEKFGFPLVIKARRHGYDGQGTFIINSIEEFKLKLASLQFQANEFLVEEFVYFTKELAIIAARAVNGDIVTYPVVETQQKQQVCRQVLTPAEIDESVLKEINQIAIKLLKSLGYVGILAIELFLTQSNKILINEIAPRTHNSGHFSLDACKTSQFEQHLRAICGLPLGSTKLICSCAVMVNLLGYEQSQNRYLEKLRQIEQLTQTHLHWYGKNQFYPGRKMAHATTLLSRTDRSKAMAIANQIEEIWYIS